MNVTAWKDPDGWDAFVEASPGACNYHRWAWKRVIEETYGHRGRYLAATLNGSIQGILPLVEIRSRLFGHSLVSVPFFSYGGVLAASEESRAALLDAAAELAGDVGAAHVELRQGAAADLGWTDASAKVAMVVELPPDADQFQAALGSRLRNKIRHAQKHGFREQWGRLDQVGPFYRVFAGNMRNLGTPVYPRSWFESLCREGGAGVRIVTLWDGAQPVAGAFLSAFRDTLEAPWIASLPNGRKDYSSVLLYWAFLRFAMGHGFRRVDLGRCTPGGGTYQFKQLWRPVEQPLHWYYWLAPGKPVPQLSPASGRFHFAIECWKHLPLFVANQLGPRIVRSLP